MAEIRFVPPPGWPAAPANWLPPTTWTPSASWPPAPTGWVFYTGAYGEPISPPHGSWMPTAERVSMAPNAERSEPDRTAPGPDAKNSADGRRPPWLVPALIGGLAIIVTGVWVMVSALSNHPAPVLTAAQLQQFKDHSTLGGLPTEFSFSGPRILSQAEQGVTACEASFAFDNSHIMGTLQSTGTEQDAYNVVVGATDTIANLQSSIDLAEKCSTAIEASPGVTVSRVTSDKTIGDVRVVTRLGPNGESIGAYYGNVFTWVAPAKQGGRLPDKDQFVAQFVRDIDSASKA